MEANQLTGQVIGGVERIAAKTAAEALGIPYRQGYHNNRMRELMLAAGWLGPRTTQIYDKDQQIKVVRGYTRQIRPNEGEVDPNDFVLESQQLSDDLPTKLERTTRMGLRELGRVLREPFDARNAGLLRAKVTAAGIAVSAQLKADEHRLKHRVQSDVLAKLLKIIERERKLLGQDKDSESESEAPIKS